MESGTTLEDLAYKAIAQTYFPIPPTIKGYLEALKKFEADRTLAAIAACRKSDEIKRFINEEGAFVKESIEKVSPSLTTQDFLEKLAKDAFASYYFKTEKFAELDFLVGYLQALKDVGLQLTENLLNAAVQFNAEESFYRSAKGNVNHFKQIEELLNKQIKAAEEKKQPADRLKATRVFNLVHQGEFIKAQQEWKQLSKDARNESHPAMTENFLLAQQALNDSQPLEAKKFAVEAFNAAMHDKKPDDSVLFIKAMSCALLENYGEAIRCFELLIAKYSQHAEVHYQLALCQAYLNRFDSALKMWSSFDKYKSAPRDFPAALTHIRHPNSLVESTAKLFLDSITKYPAITRLDCTVNNTPVPASLMKLLEENKLTGFSLAAGTKPIFGKVYRAAMKSTAAELSFHYSGFGACVLLQQEANLASGNSALRTLQLNGFDLRMQLLQVSNNQVKMDSLLNALKHTPLTSLTIENCRMDNGSLRVFAGFVKENKLSQCELNLHFGRFQTKALLSLARAFANSTTLQALTWVIPTGLVSSESLANTFKYSQTIVRFRVSVTLAVTHVDLKEIEDRNLYKVKQAMVVAASLRFFHVNRDSLLRLGGVDLLPAKLAFAGFPVTKAKSEPNWPAFMYKFFNSRYVQASLASLASEAKTVVSSSSSSLSSGQHQALSSQPISRKRRRDS